MFPATETIRQTFYGRVPKGKRHVPLNTCTFSLGDDWVFVDTNPSKTLFGHGYRLALPHDVSAALEISREELSGIGIDIDLHSGRLAKLDLARDKVIAVPFECFTPFFRDNRPHHWRTLECRGEVVWQRGKTGLRIAFYDKSTELHRPDERVMRSEIRLRHARTVRRYTRMELVSEIASTTDETLCALTEELFDRFVPPLPPLEPVPSDLTTLETIKLCAARYVSENIGFEGFRATVKQSGNSDSSARRAERQLRDLMNARKDVD